MTHSRLWFAIAALTFVAGCGGKAGNAAVSANTPATASSLDRQDQAPPAQQTGGFDGQRAYNYTAKLVSFGPHPSGSDSIKQTQNYIYSELHADGCQVGLDNFHAQTPVGTIAMQNIIAKVPGTKKGMILLMTHYDTKRLADFVGAEDGGSSTGLMLEMAHQLCHQKPQLAIWMAFLDGEEAVVDWDKDNDHTYGSRELAARMELDGDLKDVKAVVLADMIGQKGLTMKKESSSTPWLVDLIWSTAAKLGYQNVFVSQSTSASDDHDPFLEQKVPAADLIDLDDYIAEGYWHTPQDTMDKISAKNLAIVGHVIVASVDALEKKFAQ